MMDYRRLLSLVLAVMMVFSMLPVSGAAEETSGEAVQTVTDSSQENMLLQEDFAAALSKNWKKSAGAPHYVDTEAGVLSVDEANISTTTKMWYVSDKTSLWRDYDVTVNMSSPAANGCWNGFLFRVDDTGNNFYYFRFLNGRYQLGSQKGEIKLSSTKAEALDGNMHRVRVSLTGANIKVYVDDTLVFDVNDSTNVSGGVGVYSYGTVSTYDYIHVSNTGNPITEPSGTNLSMDESFSAALSSDWEGNSGHEFVVNNGLLTTSTSDTSKTISFLWHSNATSSAWKDYDISLKMSAPSANGKWNGVLFRVQQGRTGNYFFRFLNGTMQLGCTAGNKILASITDSSARDGAVHDVKISVVGSSIKVYVDSLLKLSATDSTYASGGVGFYSQYCQPAYDDLKVHVHSWADAPCTEFKNCNGCAAFIAPTEHAWVEATCTTPKTCTACGETEGEALGHAWNNTSCIVDRTCGTCGETIPAAAEHSWVDATCENPKTCSVCGETEGEALSHNWKVATCTAPKTCLNCGATEGDALTHQWIGATCEKYRYCAVCGIGDGVALGHDWVSANCTEAGYCKRCGKAGEEAYGHIWVNATCTAPKTLV